MPVVQVWRLPISKPVLWERYRWLLLLSKLTGHRGPHQQAPLMNLALFNPRQFAVGCLSKPLISQGSSVINFVRMVRGCGSGGLAPAGKKMRVK